MKFIYVCDCCKKEFDRHALKKYELSTNHLSDKMHRADGTQEIDVCKSCEEELKKPFLKQEV